MSVSVILVILALVEIITGMIDIYLINANAKHVSNWRIQERTNQRLETVREQTLEDISKLLQQVLKLEERLTNVESWSDHISDHMDEFINTTDARLTEAEGRLESLEGEIRNE